MRLTDFFQDSLMRPKGQVRATTLSDAGRMMRDFVECVGDIDVQKVRYEHGEQFIQHCLRQKLTAGTTTKKVRQLKEYFSLRKTVGNLIGTRCVNSSRPRLRSGRFTCSPKTNVATYAGPVALVEVLPSLQQDSAPSRHRNWHLPRLTADLPEQLGRPRTQSSRSQGAGWACRD
jgi:hypothetical protein